MTKSTTASLALAALLCGAVPATASAQAATAKEKEHKHAMEMADHHASSAWKELDAFHTLLAETWHPVAKSNDLKLIRAKATALSVAAQAWAASTVPASCDTKTIRDAIATVATGSTDIATMVSTQAPDSAVKNSLKALHTRFEVVEGSCKP
ncbi:MAG: hypothetical protein ABIT20_21390 [Gemmatimonadaceae bacterium]